MDKGFVSKEKPGYETTKSLWGPNKKYLKKFCNLHIIPFMRQGGIKKGGWDYAEFNGKTTRRCGHFKTKPVRE